jgi:SpoVK/Ycf46/Vps4 family AAA+-type ATPase
VLGKLKESYLHQPTKPDDRPRIGLVNISYGSLEVTRVHVTPERLVPKEQAALYYGCPTARWLDGWIDRLNDRRYGLSVLSGEPGTGKTTLLRSLASWLRETHLFYFTPASRFNAVDAGELVTFWTDENRTSKLRKVLVLEDAESILLSRNGRNGEQVASLLNLTDGVMGDALGLQVVCTINSELTDIDPALLRPGRLLARREIDRLSRDEARLLAEHLGKPLPDGETIALAELFNPDSDGIAAATRNPRRRLGFDAVPANHA